MDSVFTEGKIIRYPQLFKSVQEETQKTSQGNQRDHRARAAVDERAETYRQYGMTAPFAKPGFLIR